MLRRVARRSEPLRHALHRIALGAEVHVNHLRLSMLYAEQHHIATMLHLSVHPMVLHPLRMQLVGGITVCILLRTAAQSRPAQPTAVSFRQRPQAFQRFQALLDAGCVLQVCVQVSHQHTGCLLLLHGCWMSMVRQISMLLAANLYVRANAARISITGADHRTLRHISCQPFTHACQRVRINLMMGILTSSVVGMMCKDAANVSTSAGGLVEILAVVEDLQTAPHRETLSGVAA